jgi:organic hydroperoxide reductase OsmC/OhrA
MMMQAPFPHHYEVHLTQVQSGTGALGDGEKPQIKVGPPPQFGGNAVYWSPEELLLGSIEACLMATFFALLKKNFVEVINYKSTVHGVLNKVREGLVFERIVLQADLQVNHSDIEEATHLMHAAKKYCIVANALNVNVEFNLNVTGLEEVKYSEAV